MDANTTPAYFIGPSAIFQNRPDRGLEYVLIKVLTKKGLKLKMFVM